MNAHRKWFKLPGASWKLGLSDEALSEFASHAQTRLFMRESVGQLFARDLTGSVVLVEAATVLKPRKASRMRVQFDVTQLMAERQRKFSEGLHFVGFWHTHPEPVPTPSHEDEELASAHALAAQPTMVGIVFAIVGTAPMPDGLGLWIHDGKVLMKFQLECEAEAQAPAVAEPPNGGMLSD